MIRKPLSILLLLVLIFSMTGGYIVFKIEQSIVRKSIKQQIKEGIPENELHEFKLSYNDYMRLNWIRPGIEFRKGPNLYDVVRFEPLNDSLQLFCVNDKEEALLFAQLDEMTLKMLGLESNSPTSPVNKVVKTIKLLFLRPEIKELTKSISNPHDETFIDLKNLYSPIYLDVLTPPPDSV